MKILSRLISIPALVVVAWLGSNVYNGNELFANPFEGQAVLEDMKKSGSDFLDEKVEGATDAAKDSFNQGVDGVGDALKGMAEEL